MENMQHPPYNSVKRIRNQSDQTSSYCLLTVIRGESCYSHRAPPSCFCRVSRHLCFHEAPKRGKVQWEGWLHRKEVLKSRRVPKEVRSEKGRAPRNGGPQEEEGHDGPWGGRVPKEGAKGWCAQTMGWPEEVTEGPTKQRAPFSLEEADSCLWPFVPSAFPLLDPSFPQNAIAQGPSLLKGPPLIGALPCGWSAKPAPL